MQAHFLQFSRWLPLFLAAFFFILFSHYFFWQIGDDSYIYFRYVEWALEGQWFSWSSHSEPVEGYSSPLWYLLLTLLSSIGLQVELVSRYAGLLFALIAFYGIWVLARYLGASRLMASLALLLLSVNHGFHYWSTAGLETSMYKALFIWSAIGLVKERNWLLPVALIGLARPEGVFLLLGILFAIAVFKPHIPRRYLFLCALPAFLWLLVRLNVYGVPLPNTFYAKATGDPLMQVFKGMVYSIPALLPLLVLWGLWFRHKRHELMVILGMASMLLAIVIAGGGDWMFHFRLLVPVYGLLLAAMAFECGQAFNVKRILVSIVMVLPFLAQTVPLQFWPGAIKAGQLPVEYYQEGNMTHASSLLAEYIKQDFEDAALIAVDHAGALPYALKDKNFIDMVGLNDAHIARAEGEIHKKFDADYVFSQKPDLIILNTRVKPGTDGQWFHKGYWSGTDKLVEHPGFSDYRHDANYQSWQWKILYPYSMIMGNSLMSYILVYERKP